MKAAPSLALVLFLMTSALPLTAQERIDRTAGPISRAVTREAVRLAAKPAVVDDDQHPGESTNADWSRVRKLESGTEIMVTANSSQPGKRYVLSADDSGITVLNLAEATLPAATSKVLRDLASQNPAHFTDAQKGGTFRLDTNVRLMPDGVFVVEQKVADLGQIVERIARPQIVEIKGPVAHGSVGGAIGGAAGGFLLGYPLAINLAFNVRCQPSCGGVKAMIALSAVGLPIAGGLLGYHAFSHKTEDVIYRAP